MDEFSSATNISELTIFNALGNSVAAQMTIRDEKLSRCFRVSVEGHDTSLRTSDISGIYSLYFGQCGEIWSVVVTKDRVQDFSERVGFIYFLDEGAQEKALRLGGTNVGYPLTGCNMGLPLPSVKLGGWDVIVKALPKESCAFSPDQVAAARRHIRSRKCGFVIRGYPLTLSEDVVKTALFRLFSPCGEIIFLNIHDDPCQPGHLLRSGFIRIAGDGALEKALGLDGSDVGGWYVVVQTVDQNRIVGRRDPGDFVSVGWEGPPGYRWKDLHPSATTTSQSKAL